MRNNNDRPTFVSCLLVAILMLADVLPASAETPPKITYRNYPEWYILPKDLDFENENVIAAFQQLIDEGEAGHPAMLAIVKECEDPMLAMRALSVLRRSSGDKQKVIAELKPFFAERLPYAKDDEEWLMTAIARFFADLGTEEDVVALLPMLSHSNWRVRTLGARYLGQRGDQRVMEALEQAQSRDSDSMVVEEISKAISAIEGRLAAQDVEAEAVP